MKILGCRLRVILVVLAIVFVTPAALFLYARFVEPRWVAVRTIRMPGAAGPCRLVHISDIHYDGDEPRLARVIDRINAIGPDFVCFSGDLVEDARHLDSALRQLARMRCPVYGVPGNHDYWSRASFPKIAACFEGTGGAWLVNSEVRTRDGSTIIGRTWRRVGRGQAVRNAAARPRILLTHYPSDADDEGGARYDAILAGHTHGGQVRLPFKGALVLPYGTGKYDRGLFMTPAGPLYVNPGLGTFHAPFRFACRPEIAVITLP